MTSLQTLALSQNPLLYLPPALLSLCPSIELRLSHTLLIPRRILSEYRHSTTGAVSNTLTAGYSSSSASSAASASSLPTRTPSSSSVPQSKFLSSPIFSATKLSRAAELELVALLFRCDSEDVHFSTLHSVLLSFSSDSRKYFTSLSSSASPSGSFVAPPISASASTPNATHPSSLNILPPSPSTPNVQPSSCTPAHHLHNSNSSLPLPPSNSSVSVSSSSSSSDANSTTSSVSLSSLQLLEITNDVLDAAMISLVHLLEAWKRGSLLNAVA